MKNFEFEIVHNNRTIILHMMDHANKYISRIAHPIRQEGSFVQIHGPEGIPGEILQSLENMIQSRFARQFNPKDELKGVISIRMIDPYTLSFDIAKLWFEQNLEKVQNRITHLMGIDPQYIELDWAQEQFLSEEENHPEEND